MRLLSVLLLTLPLILIARENPFAPAGELEKTTSPEQVVTEIKQKPVPQPKVHPKRIETTSTSPVVHKKQPKRKISKKEVVNYAKARFVFRENSAYIETKDKVIRHFAISSPPSIVIDFKGYSDFASKRKVLATRPFTKLEMGAHNKSYRVVVRLDKPHKYSMKKRKYGQVITILD